MNYILISQSHAHFYGNLIKENDFLKLCEFFNFVQGSQGVYEVNFLNKLFFANNFFPLVDVRYVFRNFNLMVLRRTSMIFWKKRFVSIDPH